MPAANAIATDDAVTRDAFLGGAVHALQPARGHHRAGMEAVLLASALPRGFAGVLVDLGAGAGVAGLCAAATRPCSVVLVEREPELTACARATLALPENAGIVEQVRIAEIDIAAPAAQLAAAGLPLGAADALVMNPPFFEPAATTAPKGAARAAAHILAGDGLALWFRAAAACLKPGGPLIGIGRDQERAALLAAAAHDFGGIALLPIVPRAGGRAHRILYRATAGARGETRILPPLVMHGEANAFRPEIERIFRAGAALEAVHPVWAATEIVNVA
jgi:tRNA1(Val) A37 N6-methylase TrmN6